MTWFELFTRLKNACLRAGASKGAAAAESISLLEFCSKMPSSKIFSMFRDKAPLNVKRRALLCASKRARNTPIAYITGSQPFMEFELKVKKGVLIPRQDTAVLVEAVIKACMGFKSPVSIAECGCGSGNIAVAVCKMAENISKYMAIDKSSQAVKTACENISGYGLNNAATAFKADFFKWWRKYPYQYDIIVSNPPYIAFKEYCLLSKDVKKEPKTALLAKDNGLYYYKMLAGLGRQLLKKGSIIAVETGWKQAKAVDKIFIHNGYAPGIINKDDRGHSRAIVFHV